MFICAYIKSNVNSYAFRVMNELEQQGYILNGWGKEEFAASWKSL
jgi:hypothetical protein